MWIIDSHPAGPCEICRNPSFPLFLISDGTPSGESDWRCLNCAPPRFRQAVQEHYEAFCRQVCESLDLEARERFTRLERVFLTRSMLRCGLAEYPAVSGDPHGVRASGQAICTRCGHVYLDHPLDYRVIGHGDVPFLHVLCDGVRVKL